MRNLEAFSMDDAVELSNYLRGRVEEAGKGFSPLRHRHCPMDRRSSSAGAEMSASGPALRLLALPPASQSLLLHLPDDGFVPNLDPLTPRRIDDLHYRYCSDSAADKTAQRSAMAADPRVAGGDSDAGGGASSSSSGSDSMEEPKEEEEEEEEMELRPGDSEGYGVQETAVQSLALVSDGGIGESSVHSAIATERSELEDRKRASIAKRGHLFQPTEAEAEEEQQQQQKQEEDEDEDEDEEEEEEQTTLRMPSLREYGICTSSDASPEELDLSAEKRVSPSPAKPWKSPIFPHLEPGYGRDEQRHGKYGTKSSHGNNGRTQSHGDGKKQNCSVQIQPSPSPGSNRLPFIGASMASTAAHSSEHHRQALAENAIATATCTITADVVENEASGEAVHDDHDASTDTIEGEYVADGGGRNPTSDGVGLGFGSEMMSGLELLVHAIEIMSDKKELLPSLRSGKRSVEPMRIESLEELPSPGCKLDEQCCARERKTNVGYFAGESRTDVIHGSLNASPIGRFPVVRKRSHRSPNTVLGADHGKCSMRVLKSLKDVSDVRLAGKEASMVSKKRQAEEEEQEEGDDESAMECRSLKHSFDEEMDVERNHDDNLNEDDIVPDQKKSKKQQSRKKTNKKKTKKKSLLKLQGDHGIIIDMASKRAQGMDESLVMHGTQQSEVANGQMASVESYNKMSEMMNGDLMGEFEDSAGVGNGGMVSRLIKRGRTHTLPVKFSDSVLQSWRKKERRIKT